MKTASLINEIEYNNEKPAIKILFDNEYYKEIRIVFRKGQLMKAHKTGFPIVVEVFKGAIDFGVQNIIHSMTSGDLIALAPGEVHDLTAKEDSIVRLSLSKNDNIGRVKNVVS